MFLTGMLCWAWVASVAALEVEPKTARPGDVIRVVASGLKEAPSGKLGAQRLHFLPFGGGFQALVGLSVDHPPGPLKVWAKTKEKQVLSSEVRIEAFSFPRRNLQVSSSFTSPPKSVRQWMKDDKEAFARAFGAFEPTWFFEAPFDWPRPSKVTAPFGDLRLFNGRKKSQHFGVDLDGQTGEPVVAAQSGRVVLKRECYAAGNTVVLHHGGALFTSYFHLSRFDVEEGQEVKKGQTLGAVGASGRVTGPHLHFGVKLDNLWVNPESLLSLKFAPASDLPTSEVASPGKP